MPRRLPPRRAGTRSSPAAAVDDLARSARRQQVAVEVDDRRFARLGLPSDRACEAGADPRAGTPSSAAPSGLPEAEREVAAECVDRPPQVGVGHRRHRVADQLRGSTGRGARRPASSSARIIIGSARKYEIRSRSIVSSSASGSKPRRRSTVFREDRRRREAERGRVEERHEERSSASRRRSSARSAAECASRTTARLALDETPFGADVVPLVYMSRPSGGPRRGPGSEASPRDSNGATSVSSVSGTSGANAGSTSASRGSAVVDDVGDLALRPQQVHRNAGHADLGAEAKYAWTNSTLLPRSAAPGCRGRRRARAANGRAGSTSSLARVGDAAVAVDERLPVAAATPRASSMSPMLTAGWQQIRSSGLVISSTTSAPERLLCSTKFRIISRDTGAIRLSRAAHQRSASPNSPEHRCRCAPGSRCRRTRSRPRRRRSWPCSSPGGVLAGVVAARRVVRHQLRGSSSSSPSRAGARGPGARRSAAATPRAVGVAHGLVEREPPGAARERRARDRSGSRPWKSWKKPSPLAPIRVVARHADVVEEERRLRLGRDERDVHRVPRQPGRRSARRTATAEPASPRSSSPVRTDDEHPPRPRRRPQM